MAKKDHPAYGGKVKDKAQAFRPHILPSMFEEGVYYLHQSVGKEHVVTRIHGELRARAKLEVLDERTKRV